MKITRDDSLDELICECVALGIKAASTLNSVLSRRNITTQNKWNLKSNDDKRLNIYIEVTS